MGGVKLRTVPADKNNQLRGEALDQAIRKDLEQGLIPFYVSQLMLIYMKNKYLFVVYLSNNRLLLP